MLEFNFPNHLTEIFSVNKWKINKSVVTFQHQLKYNFSQTTFIIDAIVVKEIEVTSTGIVFNSPQEPLVYCVR